MTPSFPREFQPAVLRILHLIAGKLTPTGLSPSTAWHSSQLRLHFPDIRWSPTTPHPPCITARCSVWTLPLSVAPTNGIAFAFFSCGYSDVSFPRVPAPNGASPKGQDIPFGHPRFYGSMRLPGAFRSLARPSSAPEPSHPPAGIFAGICWPSMYLGTDLCTASHAKRHQPFPDDLLITGCTIYGLVGI